MNRDILRKEAKKIYKEQIKLNKVLKKNRIPFSQFFKQYMKSKRDRAIDPENSPTDLSPKEDFELDGVVNINNISDDSIE